MKFLELREELRSYNIFNTFFTLLLDKGPGPDWACLGPAVGCGFLTVQERFHTTSPGDYEDPFIKAEDSEPRKSLAQKEQQERLGWAALAHWEVREKGALGTGSGDQPGARCQLPIVPWVASVLQSRGV